MPVLPDFNNVNNENILKALLKDKFAKYALFMLIFLYITVFLASFICPYKKDYSNRDKAYCPPSKIYIINGMGKLSLP